MCYRSGCSLTPRRGESINNRPRTDVQGPRTGWNLPAESIPTEIEGVVVVLCGRASQARTHASDEVNDDEVSEVSSRPNAYARNPIATGIRPHPAGLAEFRCAKELHP